MKKAGLSLALTILVFLSGCTQGAVEGSSSMDRSAPAASQSAKEKDTAASKENNEFAFKKEALALVDETLAAYASGTLPEPMRYNTDYSGINNAPPRDALLPQKATAKDVSYEYRSGEFTDTVVGILQLEKDYTMDVHMEIEPGSGKPTRVVGVYFYDLQGAGKAESSKAPRGGKFLNLKSDRLFSSADFEEVRTDAGRVSGSISWSKASHFLWIDIDSMKEPFFYTYYVTGEGGLVQDYPQKDWQQYEVIHDDKMLSIAQSLFDQFNTALDEEKLLK